MRRKFLSLITILVFAWFSPVWANVLTFDDIPGSEVPIPNGYGGLNWFPYFYQLDGSLLALIDSGYDHGRVSDNHVAYNAWEYVAAASVAPPDGKFNFNGAYLAGAWNDGLNIEVKGYLGVNLLYDQTVVVNTTGSTWFNFNYIGIDKVEFASFGGTPNPVAAARGEGTHFVMDNFTFTPVPEPTTMLLLGSGLIGLVGYGKRKFKK